MVLNYNLKVIESNKEIMAKIINALALQIQPKLSKLTKSIDLQVKKVFREFIEASPEYISLTGQRNMPGNESLMGHFGFDDGATKPDAIVNAWINGIHSVANITKTITKLETRIQINVINETFTDVLSLAEATQKTGKTAKFGLLSTSVYADGIPWLRHLLLKGDTTTIMDYTITFNPKNIAASRSGQAIMIKSKSKRWFVPAPFAGTLNDNWVTRVVDKINVGPMEEIIKNNLIKIFN